MNIIKTLTLMLAGVILLTGCEEPATVEQTVEKEEETILVEETITETPVENNDVGFFNKNLEDIVETDGQRQGTIPTEEDDIYVYVILESSIVNMSENSGGVERIFTNGEKILTFYHIPASQGNMDVYKKEPNTTVEQVDPNVAILQEMRNILLNGNYAMLKIDDTQYGIIVEADNKSTSYRLNIFNNVVSDVLVETLTGSTVDNSWHINIQYGLTDDDVAVFENIF